MRITAQLIDALSGAHLWADRFGGSLEDVFELQDKVALSIAGVIEPTLQAAEMRYAVDRPTNDLTAYDLYSARALGCFDIRAGTLRSCARLAWPSDCPRTALRCRSRLGGDLPGQPRKLRLGQ
ncbi:MAG TPA: hypothetical protein VJ376_10400 [Pseudomonadota bacterium]|nr:hypothetical protein [Stellaceae bacterium]HKN09874.1 hypothetical protein [Pseudomonadota bacterium]